MPARRNGNGASPGGNGGGGSVPRWVRTLFDLHEARVAAIERTIEENKAEHEARLARLERADQVQQRKLEEMRRQTREIVVEISRLDAGRKAESVARRAEAARNLAEHLTMMAALKEIRDSLKAMNSRIGGIEQR